MSALHTGVVDMADFGGGQVPLARLELDETLPKVTSYAGLTRVHVQVGTGDGVLALSGSPAQIMRLLVDAAIAVGSASLRQGRGCEHFGCYDEHGHTDGCLDDDAFEEATA